MGMVEENDFKKKFHWKYIYLASLVPDRRAFMRCIFKFMQDDLQVRIPDVFKDATSLCWNCNESLENSVVQKCPDCDSALYCSEKCRKEEARASPSHMEICADYKKREGPELRLTKPAVKSMAALLG